MTDEIRLSSEVIPENYDLFFDIDLKKFLFSGRETIDLKIKKPTNRITLHSSGLKIKSASLQAKGKELKAKIGENKRQEQLILNFTERLTGSAKLVIEFDGQLTDSMTGLYRSKYIADGKEKHLATTQFEAPYARRAFPCFDEPSHKATFDLTVKIDKNLQALSNMPVKSEKKEGEKKTVVFQKTPRMSTYLLYIGAGDYDFLQEKQGKVLIRVVTTKGKKNQAGFALAMTKKFLKYFEDYSGIKYPLPKLDMIAIPDFAAGAMENWGAITFREVALLFDKNTSSTAAKKRIAEIIAHELWHQWSGDLVTMEWWNDLWLNESFATYMAYKAVDKFFPEWKIWEDFVADETDGAFDADSLQATHPIEVQVKDPREIDEIFDAISYDKGGSVLRMLDAYIGQENFRKGVGNYLRAHKYGNATAEDLWKFLALASKEPIKKVAEAWIRQPGYPLVTAERKGSDIVLTQKRFVFNAKDSTLWPVPLVIKTGDTVIKDMLDKKEKKIPIENDWFKVNYGQTGFYRVRYGEQELTKLSLAVENKKLVPVDRWGLQSDFFRLSRHNEITIDKYLDFLQAYEGEDNYTVLSSIYGSMRSVHFVFSQEDFWSNIWPGFKELFQDTFSTILHKLGWEPKPGEPEKDTLLRKLALSYLSFTEHEETRKRALEKLDTYVKGGKLHPDIRPSVFSIAAASSSDTYEKLIKIYTRSKSPEERVQALGALGNFKDKKLLEKALDFCVSEKVRKQDMLATFSSVAGNTEARDILLKWAGKNWKKLEAYSRSHSIFLHIIEVLITSQVTKEKEAELKKFFKKHPVEYKMTLDKSFGRVSRNVAWLEHNREALRSYFL